MLFNSYEFITIFLPVTLVGFFLLGRYGNSISAIVWLISASLFFYGWWNPIYLVLLIGSILVNYAIGSHLTARAGIASLSRRAMLVTGIAFDLGLLGYFKYMNFFVDNVNAVIDVSFHLERIILPLAISFFTFQQITYLVDSYRNYTRTYSFLHYVLFVTFFPQLIAGPIVHHSEMMPQFLRPDSFVFRHRNLAIGLTIFAIGLFKKVVIADNVAVYATPVFDAARDGTVLTFFEAWGGALAYTFQLYFDFSGYSDMAIGLARLFGIRLPLNFSSPYKATNIIDFWRRWHMTLSRFLRDYVYIPLGGSRRGKPLRYVNLLATMLLGGLWHGAGWTFVVWGGLHGVYLVVNHGWHRIMGHRQGSAPATAWGRWCARLVTFLVVVIAWVFFRAETFPAAIRILDGMAGGNGFWLPEGYLAYVGPLGSVLTDWGWRFEANGGLFAGAPQILWILVLFFAVWFLPNTQEIMRRYRPALGSAATHEIGRLQGMLRWRPTAPIAAATALVLLVSLLSLNRVSEFLYFQF